MHEPQRTVSDPGARPVVNARDSVLIPVCLVLVRFELAAALVCFASVGAAAWYFGASVVGALLIDALNAITRRHLVRVAPRVVRAQDLSRAAFNVAAAYALWVVDPNVVERHREAGMVLVALVAARCVLELAKFGRVVWRRTQGVALWRGLLTLAFLAAFTLDDAERCVAFTIYVGGAAQLEALLVSLAVRCRARVVPSLWHALRDDACECDTQGDLAS